MESLGLQAVTLSDGTTAYVQRAVEGNGSFGLWGLKGSWLFCEIKDRLIRSAHTARELSPISCGRLVQEASSSLLVLDRRGTAELRHASGLEIKLWRWMGQL